MDVVFGMWADGGAVPDHGGDQRGSIGQPVVGPSGLVDLLETKLGLRQPRQSQLVRIASFQAVLRDLGGTYFWSNSFETDPWSTSRTLLAWRDELVGFGWQDNRSWNEARLDQLAIASSAARTLPAGLVDRVALLLKWLGDAKASPVTRIRLIDRIDNHPFLFKRLLSRLEGLGCSIEEIEVSPAAPPGTSLGKLQRWMLGAALEDGDEHADGSVTIASSASEILAADIVGQWAIHWGGTRGALVAQNRDSFLLDHGLARAAQPRFGRSRLSVHRGALQLLLLAFRCAWAPFDAQALIELLVFPNSPVSPRAARHFARALENAPGRGSASWQQAWEHVAANEHERTSSRGAASETIEDRLARWRDWVEPVLADPDSGMAVSQALKICDRVVDWANQQSRISDDPLFASAASHAEDTRDALKALDQESLPRLLIEHIIDQVLDPGQPVPGVAAEAGNWRSVGHPGAIWASVPVLVWWNLAMTEEGKQPSVWTEAERSELAAAGCPADAVTLKAQAVSAAWDRSILNAAEQVFLVSSGLNSKIGDLQHPLLHRLKPALDALGIHVALESCLTTSAADIAGATVNMAPVTAQQLPAKRLLWTTPIGFQSRLEQSTNSATSLENLFSCQLMWALKHVAKIRPGRVYAIPDANRLLGNLAHEIARTVFEPGAPPDPQAAQTEASDLLEDFIDQLAAPLRQSEFAEELNFARRRLPDAMASLAQCLKDNGLTVEASEHQVSRTFERLLSLSGAVDLIARDRDANAVIIDLKWTRHETYRIEELKDGNAVQLATYGALISGDAPYRAGYFLLNQRQFATLKNSGLIGRQEAGARSFTQTWAAIVRDWDIWLHSAVAGKIVAVGMGDVTAHKPADLAISREVHCDRCDYATLCRVRGQA